MTEDIKCERCNICDLCEYDGDLYECVLYMNEADKECYWGNNIDLVLESKRR